MYHYVISTEDSFLKGQKHFFAGQVISRHRTKDSASTKAWDMRRKHGVMTNFAAIESELNLEIGQIYPDVLEAWRKADFERRAIDTMKTILDPNWSGRYIDNSVVAIWLESLKLSIEELHERYEEIAKAELDKAERERQEKAEQKARIQAITSELNERPEVCYSFPAVRGIQAGKAYYVAQIPYGSLVKLFVFDEEEVPAELRAQRTLNENRAKGIAKYMLENPSEYILPALTASVSADMFFEPSAVPGANERVGMLHIPVESTLLINDGQHRRKGIEIALEENPKLAQETAAVTIFFDEGLVRSQQIFAD